MRLCAALTAVSLLASCTTTYAIPKPELARLDGFKDDNAALLKELGDVMLNRPTDRRRAVRDVEGRTHQFTADTPLALARVAPQEELEFQRFIEVGVDAARFRGVPLQGGTPTPLVVPMEEVDHARLREFSLGKTLLLTGAIGVAVLGSLVAVSTLFEPTTGSDDDHHHGGVIDLGHASAPRLRF
ncbi:MULTISPECIES: hypothetical protein [Corallococcus]|uniref:hypothetical protein n=1 Tax=Corallococcus TaxID=83461 RepID=UPI001180F390|nr:MULTISPECIES: hypothetical protein [Corallococcus]NBD10852.1 hypothetical protein [Corallococcus silvisoli]TSC31706.1 hypothetical protein FOF48_13710 [Corallococcus sp. Z5C101001]